MADAASILNNQKGPGAIAPGFTIVPTKRFPTIDKKFLNDLIEKANNDVSELSDITAQCGRRISAKRISDIAREDNPHVRRATVEALTKAWKYLATKTDVAHVVELPKTDASSGEWVTRPLPLENAQISNVAQPSTARAATSTAPVQIGAHARQQLQCERCKGPIVRDNKTILSETILGRLYCGQCFSDRLEKETSLLKAVDGSIKKVCDFCGVSRYLVAFSHGKSTCRVCLVRFKESNWKRSYEELLTRVYSVADKFANALDLLTNIQVVQHTKTDDEIKNIRQEIEEMFSE